MKSLLTLVLLAAPALAQSPTPDTLAKKVDAHYNHLQSLQCRYSERYRGMGMDRTESGTLTLRKPGRMRWDYDSPKGKLFILDGKNAISYTPGDPQATQIPEKQLDDLRTPLRFLLGHTELAKELEGLRVTLIKLDDGSTGYTLSGAPKGMQQRIQLIELTVDASGLIHTMRIQEIDGSKTDFTFTNMRENIPTTDADFRFIPPPGVTIVNGPAPI